MAKARPLGCGRELSRRRDAGIRGPWNPWRCAARGMRRRRHAGGPECDSRPAATIVAALSRTSPALTPGSQAGSGSAQYLVYEPNYGGTYSVSSSCNPSAVTTPSFETEITAQTGGGYSFVSAAAANGPGAILDVASSGVLGMQTCTLTVRDTLYEQGYGGAYVLAPSSCATFKATLAAPVDAGSRAVLSLSATGAPTAEICTFAISDSNGNQAFAQTAYEGVP